MKTVKKKTRNARKLPQHNKDNCRKINQQHNVVKTTRLPSRIR